MRTSYALATSQFISPEFYKCARCEIGEQRESKKFPALPLSHTQCTLAEEINCNVARQSAVAKELVPTAVARQSVSRHHSSHLYQFNVVYIVQLATVKSFPTTSPYLLLPADVLCALPCNLSSEFDGSFKGKLFVTAQILGVRCQVQCYAHI